MLQLIVALFTFAFGVYMCIRGYGIAQRSWETIIKIVKF